MTSSLERVFIVLTSLESPVGMGLTRDAHESKRENAGGKMSKGAELLDVVVNLVWDVCGRYWRMFDDGYVVLSWIFTRARESRTSRVRVV
jgi:hypothetical protein